METINEVLNKSDNRNESFGCKHKRAHNMMDALECAWDEGKISAVDCELFHAILYDLRESGGDPDMSYYNRHLVDGS